VKLGGGGELDPVAGRAEGLDHRGPRARERCRCARQLRPEKRRDKPAKCSEGGSRTLKG
jgi:hypothetical protein